MRFRLTSVVTVLTICGGFVSGAFAESRSGEANALATVPTSESPLFGGGASPPIPMIVPATFSRVCVKEISSEVRARFGIQARPNLNLPIGDGSTFDVATVEDFHSAIASAAPGDLISIADGTHDWGDVFVGTRDDGGVGFEREERVWIAPRTSGGATFINTRFDVDARYLVFFDLRFVDSGITLRSEGTRVSFCEFDGGGAVVLLDPRLGISVDDIEIDNNLLTGQTASSVLLYTRYPGAEDLYPSPQRTWIHHNRFQDHSVGDRPCIGAGVGWHPFPSDQPSHTLIEYNSFDDCTADDEVVELKHRGAWIRYNLIENSGPGHLSGRMTGNAHYTGNIHLDGTSHAFRVFGNDNVGVFNLMQTYRSITTSATEPIDYPHIDYSYLAMVDHLYTMNVFWDNTVWMNIQDTSEENIDLSRGNVIRDNFWLGGALLYSDPAGDTPYEVWLANNPEGAFPGDNWIMNDAGNNCYDSATGPISFPEVVIPGDWSPLHRGELSSDVVHRLPFWWFEVLSFEE